MFAGALTGRMLYLLEAARVLPTGLPFSVPPVALEYALYAVALFGFRIFDPIPAARRAVIAQMREGVLVLDADGRVAGLNPAAERILCLPEKRATGQPVSELLPTYPGGPVAGPAGVEIELTLPAAAQAARQYVLEISPLTDWRGLEVGRLLVLRDVTEQKRAQAQVLQRQWADATLQERELLAQELRRARPELAFLNLQAQAATLYLRSGQVGAAHGNLDRLARVAGDMQGDARADRRPADRQLAVEGLAGVVRQAAARFERQTGLPVRLAVSDDLEALAETQLVRIVQEALANVRKHAGCPTQIDVRLSADDGQFHMTVADNGTGFDPALAGGGQHFGLQVMAQRARRIGGELAVRSTPGEGTRVEVRGPLAERRGDAGKV